MTTGSPDQKDSGLCILLLGRGFTGSSAGKESACNAGDPGLILGSWRFCGEGIDYSLQYSWAFLVSQLVKESAQNVGDLGSNPGLVRSHGRIIRLEKEMATHSSILAWEIPWTEGPGGLQSMGSQEWDMTEQLNRYHLLG